MTWVGGSSERIHNHDIGKKFAPDNAAAHTALSAFMDSGLAYGAPE